MLTRFATQADEEALKVLWKLVFDDDDAFLDNYFSERFKPEEVLVGVLDGSIICALHLPKASFRDNHANIIEVRNMVAVATHPQYRNKGYMGILLHATEQSIDVPIVHYPTVRNYYEKFGHTSCSATKEYDLSKRKLPAGQDHLEKYRVEPTQAKLNEAYEASINIFGGLLRDDFAWNDIISEYGSDLLLLDTQDTGPAYALIKDGIAVETAATSLEGAQALVTGLLERNVPVIRAIGRSSVDRVLSYSGYVFTNHLEGMAFPDMDFNPYIGRQF